ncbi:IlvGEDA operon leader peptide [Providencia rustigianii]
MNKFIQVISLIISVVVIIIPPCGLHLDDEG